MIQFTEINECVTAI